MSLSKLLSGIIFLISSIIFAQTDYTSGYLITDSGERLTGEIRNQDWDVNWNSFEFRESENETGRIYTLKETREFGLGDDYKFIRATVALQQSSNKTEELSDSPDPRYETQRVFLKVLLDAPASLYLYDTGTNPRFFYSEPQTDTIQPLIYKKYLSEDRRTVLANTYYRRQLSRTFDCQSISAQETQKLKYQKKPLIRFFKEGNRCLGNSFVVYEGPNKTPNLSLTVKPGFRYASLAVETKLARDGTVDFDSQLQFTFGIEAEFTLPVINRRWSLIAEPTYQSFESEKEEIRFQSGSTIFTEVAVADYKSLELPVAVRYSFYKKDLSRIFLNIGALIDVPFGDGIYSTDRPDLLDIDMQTSAGPLLGVGYAFRNQFFAEGRLIYKPAPQKVSYSALALTLGYRFF